MLDSNASFYENTDSDLEIFKEKVFSVASESIEWSTVPLVHFDKSTGLAIEIRSGVLIEIAGMHFLVTAAHEMRDHFEAGDILQIILPGKDSNPVPLNQETFWSTKDPKEDICVCQLLPKTVESMEGSFKFLRLNQMMLQNNPDQLKSLYLILGYPNAMVRPDLQGVKRVDPWKYLSYPFQGDFSKIENFDERLHLILEYSRDTKNRDQQTVHPPGLSGCGVYFSGLPITHPLLKAEDFKLVAIQTAWHKGEQYAKATWIDDVLWIIWQYYSDTRSPMRLHGIIF